MAIRLACTDCGLPGREGGIYACASCGAPLELDVDAPRADAAFSGSHGVWRYRAWLPLEQDRHIVTLGEGGTPVISLARWGEAVGAPRALAKLEHVAPTGSFKDRGMTLVVSRALELGATALIEDSSGNAGASAAAYAARAALPATVFVPATAPAAKIAQIRATGAQVVPVPGPREAVTEAALAACERSSAYYVGHNVNPYFAFGMTTFAFELIEHFGDDLPEHILLPAGGGSLYVGCWRGLRLRLGPDARLPRLHLAQPTGCPPIVAAQAAGAERAAPVERRPTIAGGAEIEHPTRDRAMLVALANTGGVAVAVSDEAIIEERRLLARLEGIDVEPTAALAPAALRQLVERGIVHRDQRVLIATTGAGLKAPA